MNFANRRKTKEALFKPARPTAALGSGFAEEVLVSQKRRTLIRGCRK
jgi:hypothetical protein